MVSAFGDLNGSGNQQVWVETHLSSQNAGGNYSQYYGELRYYGNGWGSWTGGTQYWSTDFGGYAPSGTFNIPQGEAYWTYKTLWSGYWNRGHDGNGYGSAFNVRGSIDTNHSSIGDGSAYTTEGAPPRIAKVPGKPPRPVYAGVSAVSIDYTFTGPSDNGGSGIDQYEHQSATDSGFSQNVQTWRDDGSPGQATNLIPGTGTWIRFRAHNGVGWGPYSDALSQTTLPAVPPGITVSPSPSGTSASVSLTPPGGVSGVTEYIVWYRPTPAPQTPVTEVRGLSPVTINGLTPGASYDYQAAAVISGYVSPVTAWVTQVQPKPNTSPGDYFDGDSPDTPDVDYTWDGTPGNSPSRSTGKGVTGWIAYFAGAPGAQGTLYQTTGAFAGDKSARVAFLTDATAVSQWNAGQAEDAAGRTTVEPSTAYVGSLYVNPQGRSQRLRATVLWMDLNGGIITEATGGGVIAPADTWTRLLASGTSPTNAEFAAVRVVDEDGEGYAHFLSGQSLLLDAAMITLGSTFDYFDGDTPDSPEFQYDWMGTAHASISARTPLDTSVLYDPLDDPDCADIPAPPRPPAVPADCITEVGTWRRYWAELPEEVISDWLEVIPTITVTSGRGVAEPAAPLGVNQVRIRVYENPDNLDPSAIDLTTWISEQIISYMPPFTTITLDGVSQRAWAEVDGGDPLPADKLLYGSDGVPATWPILSCGQGYLFSFDTPLEVLVGNVTTALALTERLG
jgi:hypothetical protein